MVKPNTGNNVTYVMPNHLIGTNDTIQFVIL